MLFAFDCDGVLVDSEIIASEVDAEFLAKAGYEITAEEVTRRFAGLTGLAIYEQIEAETGRKLPAGIDEEIREEIDRRLDRDLKPTIGALDVFDRIDGPRCVCSNSSGRRLTLSLEKVGLYDRVRPYVYSAVEVGTKEPKPAPNVYSYAAEQFEVSPRDMLVIEDSVFGVRAAKAAGARVIGFTGGRHTWLGHADILIEAGAETVIHRFDDLAQIAEALMAWEGME